MKAIVCLLVLAAICSAEEVVKKTEKRGLGLGLGYGGGWGHGVPYAYGHGLGLGYGHGLGLGYGPGWGLGGYGGLGHGLGWGHAPLLHAPVISKTVLPLHYDGWPGGYPAGIGGVF